MSLVYGYGFLGPRSECGRRDCPYRTPLRSGAYDDREARIFLDLVADKIPSLTGWCRRAASNEQLERMDGGLMSLISLAIDWGRRRQAEGAAKDASGSIDVDLLPDRERFSMLEMEQSSNE